MPLCGDCKRESAQRKCSLCHVIYYCDIECQRAAWPNHRKRCVNGATTLLFPAEGDVRPVRGTLSFGQGSLAERVVMRLFDISEDKCLFMIKECHDADAPANARAANLLLSFRAETHVVRGPALLYQEVDGDIVDLTFTELAEIAKAAAVRQSVQVQFLTATAAYVEGVGRIRAAQQTFEATGGRLSEVRGMVEAINEVTDVVDEVVDSCSEAEHAINEADDAVNETVNSILALFPPTHMF